MFVTVVGLNHKKAPVEIREKLAFTAYQIPELFERLISEQNIAGTVILSTCNRTEIYAVSKNSDLAMSGIWNFLAVESGIKVEELRNYLYNFTCREAVMHLFRVSSGLDSMVLGETEILGQVSEAYQIALENSASNAVLNILFQKALSVGKKVRSETNICCGAVSFGYAAVNLAEEVLDDIKNSTILLIGAGKVSELVAKNLSEKSTKVIVCNRSYDKAVNLSSKFNGYPKPFEQLCDSVAIADIVVSCTASSDYIITKERLTHILKKRDGKKIFLIDLAVPRDIEPQVEKLPDVYLYNIDNLQKAIDKNLKERKKEVDKAEYIVQNAVEYFMEWLNDFSVVPVIKALRIKGEEIKNSELEKTFSKMKNLSEKEKQILSSMANSIVNKLLHTPTVQIKKFAQNEQGHLYAQVLRNLFDLSLDIDKVVINE